MSQDENAVNETMEPAAIEENHVPYDRFKEVNDKFNAEKTKREELERIVAQMSPAKEEDDGTVDVEKLEQSIIRKVEAQSIFKEQWKEAEAAYPKLKTNKRFADAVRGLQLEVVKEGKYLSASEAAKDITEMLQEEADEARQEGRKEATVSETIQKRAGIDAPSGATAQKGLAERFKAGELSKDEIRANWGKIQEGLRK